ncbi:RodZ domain-containing protein [Glaciecola sp. 1036]|uniref:RodZ domain-containing protein n=1 Tax=Alteromonadaceae TaxID=72275 RepID=UPI003D03C1B1
MNNEETLSNEPITPLSPGTQLKNARERMGLSQEQVANRLKLRLASIQAIEEDGMEQGVSITFTKGYVRLYARLVNMEVTPLLDAFDNIHVNDKSDTKLQSFSRRVEREAHDSRWNLVTYGVIILVIASLGYWWYDQQDYSFADFTSRTFNQSDDANEAQPVEQSQTEQVIEPDYSLQAPETTQTTQQQSQPTIVDNADDVEASSLSEEVEDVMDTAQETVSETVNDIEESVSQTVDSDETLDDDSLLQSDTDIQPQSGAEVTDANSFEADFATEVQVVFTFREDCWLSVKDANGETVAVGVKKQGRVMTVMALPPISVNLCPTEKVDIEFNHELVDLSRFGVGSPVKFQLPLASE